MFIWCAKSQKQTGIDIKLRRLSNIKYLVDWLVNECQGRPYPKLFQILMGFCRRRLVNFRDWISATWDEQKINNNKKRLFSFSIVDRSETMPRASPQQQPFSYRSIDIITHHHMIWLVFFLFATFLVCVCRNEVQYSHNHLTLT